jgi:hypothetical protein
LEQYLFSRFTSDQIQIIPLKDTRTTGNFEVTVVDTGQLLHSKRHAGQGRAESDAERNAIAEQIQELISSMEEL